MSKIYNGQPLLVQLDCKTDVSTGSPTKQIEFLKPDGVTKLLRTATLVSGSTTVIEYQVLGSELNASGIWYVQAVITDGSNPAWRGETAFFAVFEAFK